MECNHLNMAARPTPSPDVRILQDEQTLAKQAAAAVAVIVSEAAARQGRCAIALSGGSTPRALYRELAASHRTTIPWAKVHVFWGDERIVPLSHPDNNSNMAKTTLLDLVPCPEENIHRIPTDLRTPEAGAMGYAETLRDYFGAETPAFDLLLLGIGADGHTASLFPHSSALDVTDHTVIATVHPENASARVTLTMPVLLAARVTFVLATGAAKAPAIARALDPNTKIVDCPAAALRHSAGPITWWVDRGAAGVSE